MIIRQLICLLVLLPGLANAEIFKWVDQTGKVHFGDAPQNSEHVEKVDININTYQPVISDDELAMQQDKVVMYATSWCGYCRKARNYFKSNNIAFIEYDIEKNMSAKRRYDSFGGRGVPVIFIGKQRMNGFSTAGFKRLYELVTN